jgi:hypothetical protein
VVRVEIVESALTIVLLGAQALAFAVWTLRMFRCLFKMRRHAVAISGQAIPGMHATFAALRTFLHSADFSNDRKALLRSTCLLLVLTLLFTFTRS